MSNILSIIYLVVSIALCLSLIYFGVKGFEARKKEPKNYIEFYTIDGKRVAILHMSEVPNANDDSAILSAFSDAMHLLYNDDDVDETDFQIAWDAYNEFRNSVAVVNE